MTYNVFSGTLNLTQSINSGSLLTAGIAHIFTLSEAECVYCVLLIAASVRTHDTGTGKSWRLALSLQGWCCT